MRCKLGAKPKTKTQQNASLMNIMKHFKKHVKEGMMV
jgi:hypothetical protein